MVVSSASIGSIPNPADWQNRHLQLQQDLEDLEAAFQTGDLTAAKKALSDMESLKPPDPPQQATGVNPMEEDMSALEDALNDGDLEAAKEAFAALKAGFERGGPQGPPPPTQVGESSNEIYQSLLDLLNRASLDGESTTKSDSDNSTTAESILATMLAFFKVNASTGEDSSSLRTTLNSKA